jgi:trans-aconitate methyltransferase
MSQAWDPALYARHGYVHRMAGSLVELLEPKAGERVLDVGCGTGELTRAIALAGARVVGVDASASMIEAARRSFPELDLRVMDAREMRFEEPFDAVFSNATLHWVRPPEKAAARIFAALRPGGRLVAEFGAEGNVRGVLMAAEAAGRDAGVELGDILHANYFPSAGAYAELLRRVGFTDVGTYEVDRPTPLEGPEGLRAWVRMFRPAALERVPDVDAFFQRMEDLARPFLYVKDAWHADYRRLRVRAIRPS